MGLVTERLFDPDKELYVSKDVKFDGRDYKKGDKAPVKDMSRRTLLKYFRTGLFVHEVRKHKSEPKAEEPKVEEPKAEPAQAEEKPAPKKRGRRPAKSKTE